MSSLWLVTVVWWMATSIGAEFLRDCHTTDPKPYIYYATKTPYELINNEDSSPIFVAGMFNIERVTLLFLYGDEECFSTILSFITV